MTCGIYQLKNIVTGKVYVGSSCNIERRKYEHIRLLQKGNHHSLKLQNSWNKHGEENFVFSILKEVEEANLREVEQEFIDLYDSWKNGYNQTRETDGVSRQKIFTECSGIQTLVNIEIKQAFKALCALNGTTPSEYLRELIEEKVKANKLD